MFDGRFKFAHINTPMIVYPVDWLIDSDQRQAGRQAGKQLERTHNVCCCVERVPILFCRHSKALIDTLRIRIRTALTLTVSSRYLKYIDG